VCLAQGVVTRSGHAKMELHEPITFSQTSFRERSLQEEPDPAVRHAVVPLHEARAFFFTGAGSSAGAPTGLPTGPQLAAELVTWAHESGAGAAVDALEDATDLGQVCAALENALDRDSVVRHIRKMVEWRNAKINLCHLAIALLYAEGVLRVSFTANWDPKLEDALDLVICQKRPQVALDEATMGEVGGDPCLVHLHGHYSDPGSLVMTDADLAKPNAIKWTDPTLRAALAAQDPIFVGFAAEPAYVIHSLTEMRAAMQRAPAGVIALESLAEFCAKSTALAAALKLAEDGERYVEGDALEVMGELLRCCYRKLLDEVLDDAEARARAADGTAQVIDDEGARQVREALRSLSLESLLALLWATSAKAAETGTAPQATLLCLRSALAEALAVLMVLASCRDAKALSVTNGGFRLEREDGSGIDLWPAIPSQHLSPSAAVARAYRHGDRFAKPADSEVPLVIVCAGTSGALPADGKVSLIGAASAAKIGTGQREPAGVIDLREIDARFNDAPDDATLLRGLGF
jgi:hypothetical protein